MDGAWAFPGANIEPDARARLNAGGLNKTVNDELVPPDRRRERGNLAKHARMFEAQVEGHQPAQRRTADPRVPGTGKRAVFTINERLHFFHEESCVAIGPSSAK